MLLDQKMLQRLNEIGMALSRERNILLLMEKILMSAKELTTADGGTFYTVTKEGTLRFEIVISDSLGFWVGGSSTIPVSFENLSLFLPDGSPNDSLMVAYTVN